MGDITVTSAVYTVDTQTIDVSSTLNTLKTQNYGAIELPIAKLDADLRKDNRITAKPDADTLKINPPVLSVDYTDETGAAHHVETSLNDSLSIGNRSMVGNLLQKPGEMLWGTGMMFAKAQIITALVLFWALVVIWTFKQWTYLAVELRPTMDMKPGNPITYTTDNYGIFGKYIMMVVFAFITGTALLTSKIDKNFGVPPYGWLARAIMTLISGVAPVGGFFLQLMIWFTTVHSIEALKSKPVDTAQSAVSAVKSLIPQL